MKDPKRNMAVNDGGIPGNLPDGGLPFTGRDVKFFNSFGKYLRGRNDLEEVRNDPDLDVIGGEVNKMVSEFNLRKEKNSDYQDFIKDSFASSGSDAYPESEIPNINLDYHRSKENDLTPEWVKEWHENRKKSVKDDIKSREIREYINGSLETDSGPEEVNEPGMLPYEGADKGIKRSLLIRYVSLSAAAVIGLFFLIRTILPTYDSEKLYRSYYSPIEMVSAVTRGNSPDIADKFPQAVEKYRSGDYKSAQASFSSLVSEDPTSIAPRFLLGLSYLALNDPDKAIAELDKLALNSNTYNKEANWYLGLAYLKKGEKDKAAKCLEILVQSPGYYTERSKELLRRLK